MNRRHFFQTFGASTVSILAGCNTSKNKPNNDSNSTEKGEDKELETKMPTEIPQSVGAVITHSRRQLTNALTTLNDTDVVEDNEIGIVTSDKFEKFRKTTEKDVIKPASEAQRDLESIRDEARGNQALTGKILLGISVFTQEKWREYTDIVRAFTAFGISLSKIAEEDARASLDAAQDSVVLLNNVEDHRSKLEVTLRRIRSANGNSGIRVWKPTRESSELDSMRAILYEMKPAFRGLQTFVTATVQGGKAANLTENGQYSEAMHLATSSRANMDNATRLFQKALKRNVRYYEDLVTVLECQTSDFYIVSAILVDAIQAYQEGDQSKGDEQLAEYREKLSRTGDRCQISRSEGA